MSRRSEPASGTLLLLGGRSEIGLEVATRLAPGRTVVLAARRSSDLATQRSRVLQAGATTVDTVEFDANAMDTHEELLRSVVERHGPIGIVVLAFGILGDQTRAEDDAAHALEVITTDFLAQVSVLTHAAKVLRAQKNGDLVVFSSVAGVRVRRANYVYGSAKAGLDGFASGLSDSLHGSGVHLLLARPGFVIGSMTEGMDPAPMSSTPDQVAAAVVAALRSRKSTVWIPGTLRPVFFAMRLLPQWLWRRMPR
ncbi:SDR family NAD(P)-dependent oxidoreductase [Rhodococcus fascians]|uniref:SDR family NAD(P)-dependent oxidoreductase n=1 Tax=Rhodococcoides fascians TaxID=1828 RepID=UPI0019607254|nr:SDR family NAD(P)-dependent oxidoreductase [Rhodococcus fascians]MBM7244553.1 SDR family NAD(P)-dependent oxidoreductase [Rhodococcus fascians]MBY3807925.1 SDR family NAD(P)-dependent oxidoreductase [Rhodococcus fascians]MBY3839472.1 SDR family NAD(P)-dependent oxidoreductase [Rhodococcus fascians]MBY3846886.1 SDR family NAD(P)-dependent oxidoreductase [Rhodococcus fascians]MBY3851473.1 SDR family NAD(P)-dependent oxidoreductase [Rhodococcus fascians]